MNQIIFYIDKKKNAKKYIFLYLIFLSSILLILIFFVFCINSYHKSKIIYENSEFLSDAIKIQYLYKNTSEVYSSLPIIGQINIKKINISYPIFSYTDENLLKKGICRLYGPMPNNNGNLCLAGHNFNNDKFFSNLSKLTKNDIITIYDNFNISTSYSITQIFEVNSDDFSILNQNEKIKEITLITCNNLNKKRIIVKAKEID